MTERRDDTRFDPLDRARRAPPGAPMEAANRLLSFLSAGPSTGGSVRRALSIYADGTYLEKNRSWHAEDAPWKARQILRILRANGIAFRTVAEIGCGSGEILRSLAEGVADDGCTFDGFDISPQAIAIASRRAGPRLRFHQRDLLCEELDDPFDLLLAIDVFEHVPDYLGFLERCREKAKHKVFHIPLDIHVSGVLRANLTHARDSVGHLHFFTAETALATLRGTGYEIVDSFFTAGALELVGLHPSLKTSLANLPRRALALLSTALAARLLGGYSLLVLAR